MMNWTHMLLVAILSAALAFAQSSGPAQRLQQAVDLMETRGDYPAAIRLFEETSKGADRTVAARALLYLGLCYEKLGASGAEKAYQRLIRDFADQSAAVAEARTRLARLGRPPGSSAGSTMITRRISDGPGADLTGSPSPDARFFSYVDWSTGDLAIRELATGADRRLTNKGPWSASNEYGDSSVFSPDGKQVAYSWAGKNEAFDLRVIDAGGSEPRVLYRNEDVSYLQPAQWSPDGKSILTRLVRKDRTNQIALVSVADGSVKILKTLDWRRPVKMSYSPDGRSIVYDFPPQENAAERDIYLLAADGSRETRLVEHPANDLQPVWTPDGKQVVFISDRMRTFDVWAVRVINGRPEGPPELLKSNIGHIWPWGFARNGSYVYGLQSARVDVHIASMDLAEGALLAAPKPASQRFLGAHDWPDWSPDGKRLAFVYKPGLGGPGGFLPILCIQSLETGQQRELMPRLYMSRLRWSPDGRFILVNGRDHNFRGGLYRIDVETGEAQAIVHSEPLRGYPRQSGWLGDGSAVLYVHVGGPILRRDLASGQEQEIYRGVNTFDLSPDGRWLALGSWDAVKKTAVLKIAPASGGEAREILRLPEPGTFSRTLTWTRDSRYILFTQEARAGPQAIAELWRVPAEGGEPQRLGLAMEHLREVRVHPDGQRLAFVGGRDKYEVWVMENFLPGRRETR